MHAKAVFDLAARVVFIAKHVLSFELSFRLCMVVLVGSSTLTLASHARRLGGFFFVAGESASSVGCWSGTTFFIRGRRENTSKSLRVTISFGGLTN